MIACTYTHDNPTRQDSRERTANWYKGAIVGCMGDRIIVANTEGMLSALPHGQVRAVAIDVQRCIAGERI